MSNLYMLGLVRLDHFNIRSSLLVVGFFGVVTIVSYFNELNKAGLLRRGGPPQPIPHYLSNLRLGRSVDTNAIIQKNGDVHHLGLEIMHLKENAKKASQKEAQEINIRVHLGKNSSYEKVNNSIIPVYSHKNSLPNYFTALNPTTFPFFNSSALQLSNSSVVNVTSISVVVKKINDYKKGYQKAVMVYMYQHDPKAYLLRDCLKKIIQVKKLAANSVPISSGHRKQWDLLSKRKRNGFQVVYGSLTFGLCESINHGCNYITLVSHPLDRLVMLYEFCKSTKNESHILCRANHVLPTDMSLQEFAKAHGSSLFQSLVDYAKRCRLIGEDEVCLQDSRTSFIVSKEEMQVHLQHVLGHLESWFGVIALGDRLQESLALLQELYGYPFSACERNMGDLYGQHGFIKKPPKWLPLVRSAGQNSVALRRLRAHLLNDTIITTALHADLEIYNKFKEIYERQVASQKMIHFLKKTELVLKRRKFKKRGHLLENLVVKKHGRTSKNVQSQMDVKALKRGEKIQHHMLSKEDEKKKSKDTGEYYQEATEIKRKTSTTEYRQNMHVSPKYLSLKEDEKHDLVKTSNGKIPQTESSVSVLGRDPLLYQRFPTKRGEVNSSVSTTSDFQDVLTRLMEDSGTKFRRNHKKTFGVGKKIKLKGKARVKE